MSEKQVLSVIFHDANHQASLQPTKKPSCFDTKGLIIVKMLSWAYFRITIFLVSV